MEFFASLVCPQHRLIIARNSEKVELGREVIPDPSSLSDAIALFGSAQNLVKSAMANLDIAIQAKIRSRKGGSQPRNQGAWRE